MTYDDDFEELDVVLVLYRLLSYVELHQFKIALQSFQPKLLLTKASSVDTPKPTPKAAATSPAKAAVAAAAAASAAKPGFTSVASVAMGSAVPKLALDPLKTSQPVPVAPVAMAQAAEPSRRAVASMAHPYHPPLEPTVGAR